LELYFKTAVCIFSAATAATTNLFNHPKNMEQIEIIQSLGEALTLLTKDRERGVATTQMSSLCGRIGELYVALITNGRMATEVNQKGFDVVSDLGERISVKTTATKGGHGVINLNMSTLHLVDRVIVLRIDIEEKQIVKLFDDSVEKLKSLLGENSSSKKLSISVGELRKDKTPIESIKEVRYDGAIIRELETGTIEIERNGDLVSPAKPELRKFAEKLGLDGLIENGGSFTTRQLGNRIIKAIQERAENTIREVPFDDAIIRELETGTIEVERNGGLVSPTKPELRKFAAKLGLDVLLENGDSFTTRQLGNRIIKAIQERAENKA
jgi:hypothetical protein